MAHKQTIYGIDRTKGPEAGFEAALSHYVYALSSIEGTAIDVNKEAAREFQIGLRMLCRELAATPDRATADASHPALLELLKTYRKQLTDFYNQKDADVREILLVLGNVTENLSTHGEQQTSRLKNFTRELQKVSQCQDLNEIRRALTRQVVELRTATEAMWKENNESVQQLQSQLSDFQQRLARAEALASTDELTGLLNRREGESRLAERMQGGAPFCLMVLDLDRFKAINDNMGHAAGDQVLRHFARQLSKLVRPTDLACRWGGDEFVVLMDCELAPAEKRAADLRSKLTSQVIAVLIGKEFSIPVSASIGVAEHEPGEDAEHLFARADEALYRQKKPTPRLLTA